MKRMGIIFLLVAFAIGYTCTSCKSTDHGCDDKDSDGICDVIDVCKYDPENDVDNDGVCGNMDICPYDAGNDADQDGFCAPEDCQDRDELIHPDAEEITNNDVDENCDGLFTQTLYSLDEYDGLHYTTGGGFKMSRWWEKFYEFDDVLTINQNSSQEGPREKIGIITFNTQTLSLNDVETMTVRIFMTNHEELPCNYDQTLGLQYLEVEDADLVQWETCLYHGSFGYTFYDPPDCYLPLNNTDCCFLDCRTFTSTKLVPTGHGWFEATITKDDDFFKSLNPENNYMTFLLRAECIACIDGLALIIEDGGNRNGTGNIPEVEFELNPDFDQDGVINELDMCEGSDDSFDEDGDFIPDGCDICLGFNDFLDGDTDGLPDGCDYCPSDEDSDMDGLCDKEDDCPLDPENDLDGDYICADQDICPYDEFNDWDGDSLCANQDPCPFDEFNDWDGDSLCANQDPCPFDFMNDEDKDGVCSDFDLCSNYDDRIDSDGDGFPDNCDYWPGWPDNDPIFSTSYPDLMRYYYRNDISGVEFASHLLNDPLKYQQVGFMQTADLSEPMITFPLPTDVEWSTLEAVTFKIFMTNYQEGFVDQTICYPYGMGCLYPYVNASVYLADETIYTSWQDCLCDADSCTPIDCAPLEIGLNIDSFRLNDEENGWFTIDSQSLADELRDSTPGEKMLLFRLRLRISGYQPQYLAEVFFEDGLNQRGTGNLPSINFTFHRPNIVYADLDGDGFGDPNNTLVSPTPPSGYVINNTDCNDGDSTINPLGEELLGNTADEDCNGSYDIEIFSVDQYDGTKGTRFCSFSDAIGNSGIITFDVSSVPDIGKITKVQPEIYLIEETGCDGHSSLVLTGTLRNMQNELYDSSWEDCSVSWGGKHTPACCSCPDIGRSIGELTFSKAGDGWWTSEENGLATRVVENLQDRQYITFQITGRCHDPLPGPPPPTARPIFEDGGGHGGTTNYPRLIISISTEE